MLPSLFLLASALSFFACGDKKPPAVSISPSVLEAKESPLSLLPMQYDSKLNPDQYATIEAATEIPLLRWDFSEELSTTYQFSQQATSTSRYNLSAEAPEPNIQKITATGIIKIQSTGDSQAELSILDLQTTMHLGSTDDPQEISQTMTPIILQGFQEDSHLSAQLSASSGGMDLLFRLPKTKLKLGESISIPVETPFNAMGSLLMVKGETTITLHQWVTIADQLCIQMQIQTVVDQLDIPESMEGEYTFLKQESSILYFDINAQQFVEGTMVALMEFSVDAPNPQMSVDGETASTLPTRTQMSMRNETLIQYSLHH